MDGVAGEQPTIGAIRRRVQLVTDLAEPGDTLLFFFSGHGVARDGKGYLVPLDGDTENAIAFDWIKSALTGSKASSKVLILDACAGSAAKGVSGIAPSLVADASGLSMLLSNAENEQSYPDETTGRSVFTASLIAGLDGGADSNGDSLITEGELFTHVKESMKSWCVRTGKKQVPQGFGVSGDAVVLAARGIPVCVWSAARLSPEAPLRGKRRYLTFTDICRFSPPSDAQ